MFIVLFSFQHFVIPIYIIIIQPYSFSFSSKSFIRLLWQQCKKKKTLLSQQLKYLHLHPCIIQFDLVHEKLMLKNNVIVINYSVICYAIDIFMEQFVDENITEQTSQTKFSAVWHLFLDHYNKNVDFKCIAHNTFLE